MIEGYISYIYSRGYYGFIDSPDLSLDHIFFHLINCEKSYKNIHKGDKVNFELNPNGEKGIEATNISFIQNSSLDELRKDFENNTSLKGFLKKIDDKYYVKDRETYILIPLIIARYETNIKEVYEDNLNVLIDYKIITLTDKNKIRAIKINRQFLPECKLLVNGNKTEGLVVANVKGGYQIKIYDNILVFLPNSSVLKSKRNLELGELINVTCIKASDNLENVAFYLTENTYDYYRQLIIDKENFIASLKPGDKFLGKIISVKGDGLFINIGLCVGLLHLKNILNDYLNLSKQSKKEYLKLFEQEFNKEQEIEVIFEENIKNRISFTYDKSLEVNKKLYQNFFNLREKIDNDKQLIIDKENFIASLKPGDRFLGKIISVQLYGLFISIGLCEGLLHITKILNDNLNLSKQSKKEYSKIFEQAFVIGQEIEVIVKENIENRILLTWDKSLEVNKKLYQDFYTKFKQWDTNR